MTMPVNRRQHLLLYAGLAAGAVTARLTTPAQAQQSPPPPAEPAFKLPPLGYAYEALEPHIDTATMRIHYTGHHAAYVAALNGLVGRYPELATTPMETLLAGLNDVPQDVRAPVRNNLGGHWNHTFFWEIMKPGGAKDPSGELKAAIESHLGSVAQMVEKLSQSGLGRFGSGWAWLVVDKDKKLAIVSTANQDTPIELGAKAVIGVDVWEHAYYLKHQNRRADYIKAWWNVVNWDKANENFKKAMA